MLYSIPHQMLHVLLYSLIFMIVFSQILASIKYLYRYGTRDGIGKENSFSTTFYRFKVCECIVLCYKLQNVSRCL